MLVSVVIPTLNAGSRFRETLGAIFDQRVDADLEVIVVDSGSVDGTLALCREYPIKVLEIPAESFSHGGTRNLGISRSHGASCVFLVQDAVPVGTDWLHQLLQPLRADPRIAGVYARQIPYPEADTYTRLMFEMWGVSGAKSVIREIGDMREYTRLSWEQKAAFCAFSNVSSVLRRSVWEQHPFLPLPYAEDLAWAREVLEAGYRLVYNPEAVVMHSHQRPWREVLQRTFIDGRTVPRIFQAEIAPLPFADLDRIAKLLRAELESATVWATRTLPAVCDPESVLPRPSPQALGILLRAESPWLHKTSSDEKWLHLLDGFETVQGNHRFWRKALRKGSRVQWLELLSLPVVGKALFAVLWRTYWIWFRRTLDFHTLLWLYFTDHATVSLPDAFTVPLLTYLQRFREACVTDPLNVWRHVLIDVAGKLLGQQAYGAEQNGSILEGAALDWLRGL